MWMCSLNPLIFCGFFVCFCIKSFYDPSCDDWQYRNRQEGVWEGRNIHAWSSCMCVCYYLFCPLISYVSFSFVLFSCHCALSSIWMLLFTYNHVLQCEGWISHTVHLAIYHCIRSEYILTGLLHIWIPTNPWRTWKWQQTWSGETEPHLYCRIFKVT